MLSGCSISLHSTKKDASPLLINDNCTIKRKTLQRAYSRIHNQNNALFAPSLLKIRATRFVLCLYSHNYFEQEIKNAVFFAQFTYVSRIYFCVLEKMTTLRDCLHGFKKKKKKSKVSLPVWLTHSYRYGI